VKIQIEVFWVVTPYSVAVGYQRFEVPCASIFRATLHCVTAQRTATWTISLSRRTLDHGVYLVSLI